MIIVFLKEHFIQSDRKIQKQVAKLTERSKSLDLRSGTCKNVGSNPTLGKIILSIYFLNAFILLNGNLDSFNIISSCGLMVRASDFGSDDCRFESCHDLFFLIII